MRLAQDTAANAMQDIKARLRKVPHDVESIISQTEANLQNRTEEVEHKAEDVEHRARNTAKGAIGMPVEGGTEGEDDEGWMSDASDGEPRTSTSAKGKKPVKKQPKSTSQRPTQSTSRRRSIRHGLLGLHGPSRTHSEGEVPVQRDGQDDHGYDAGTESPDERRGRRIPHTNSSTTIPSSPQLTRPQHARIDSIRSVDARLRTYRDLSPARSVRFVDEPGGHGSPRIPLTPSYPTTPLSISEAPSEAEDDSPRNQVRFSLPDPSERRA